MSVLQGLILAVVFAKYHSAGRMSAGYLILSDSTPKIKLVFQNIVAFDYIKRVEFLSTGIEFGLYYWLILIDNLRTLITVLRDSYIVTCCCGTSVVRSLKLLTLPYPLS